MTDARSCPIQEIPASGRDNSLRNSSMFISRKVISTFVAAGFAAAASVANAGDLVLTVRNANGTVSIQRLWTAPAGTRQPWTETFLESPILGSRLFTFENSVSTCLFDVKIQFSDGVVETFDNVNVCRGDSVRAD